jgi:hypothetical protein
MVKAHRLELIETTSSTVALLVTTVARADVAP